MATSSGSFSSSRPNLGHELEALNVEPERQSALYATHVSFLAIAMVFLTSAE